MNIFPSTNRFLKHKVKQDYLINEGQIEEFSRNYLLLEHTMPRVHGKALVFYKLEQLDELMIKEMYYFSTLEGDELALLDAYVTLVQNRPLEAIDRLSSKEIDFYLRDDIKKSSFNYYPSLLFDYLSIGESIKKSREEKRELIPYLDVQKNGHFYKLSTSEQFEMIEDILGEYFFSEHPNLARLLVCEEISEEVIVFNLQSEVSLNNLVTDILKLLKFHLSEEQISVKVIQLKK